MGVSDPDIGAIERSCAGVVPHRKDAKRCAISGVQFRNAPVHLQVVALIHHPNVGPIKSDASRLFAYGKRLGRRCKTSVLVGNSRRVCPRPLGRFKFCPSSCNAWRVKTKNSTNAATDAGTCIFLMVLPTE